MALSGWLNNNINVSNPSKKLCKFEIRLDQDFIVLHGFDQETNLAIKGRVVLMTNEAVQLKGLKITLKGRRRTVHTLTPKERQFGPPVGNSGLIMNNAEFLRNEIKLTRDGHGVNSLKAGNHEFPFEFVLPSDTPESIEGMSNNFVSYDLKTTAERGVLAKDLMARKRVRIIRTLGDDPTEVVDAQQVASLWPNKIKYQFTTQSRAAIFGDKVTTDVEFTPLLDKLRIGTITTILKETQKIKTTPGPEYAASGGWQGMWKKEIEICKQQTEIPEGSDDTDLELQMPMFKFKLNLPLPKSLAKCRQSVEQNEWIRIRHTMHYDVMLINPDGHHSQLKVHHNIKLFISPRLPVGDNNSVGDVPTDGSSRGLGLLEDMQNAPPGYGTHQLDRLYLDIDAAGYQTPAGFQSPATRSGVATPYSISRRGSWDHSSQTPHALHDAAHPQALSHRLMNLQEDGTVTSIDERVQNLHIASDSSSAARSPERTQSSSHNLEGYFPQHGVATQQPSPNSVYRGAHTPPDHAEGSRHVEYNMHELEKMPSYETAIRTPCLTPASERPPTYADATSRPPSPVHDLPYAAVHHPNPAHAGPPQSTHHNPSGSSHHLTRALQLRHDR